MFKGGSRRKSIKKNIYILLKYFVLIPSSDVNSMTTEYLIVQAIT